MLDKSSLAAQNDVDLKCQHGVMYVTDIHEKDVVFIIIFEIIIIKKKKSDVYHELKIQTAFRKAQDNLDNQSQT